MKIYRLPSAISALIFDMDLTLYSHAGYGQYQIDILVERLGKLRGLSFEEMKRSVEEVRETWAESHGGLQPSLSNILLSYGISMEENIRWREEANEPERFLKKDQRLVETMKVLSRSFTLGVVTNNPVLVARKTLAVLGVGDLIPVLVGLDTCMVSKPHEKPFVKFLELAACPVESCVSIGDRHDIDLAIPLKMGMGGILVDGVEDVYELPEVLTKN